MGFYSISGTATPSGVSTAQFAHLGPNTSAVSKIYAPGAVVPLLGSAGQATSGAVTTWQLRNISGTVVSTGGAIAANGSWTIPAVPYGWYRLYFYNGSGTYIGGDCLVVTRSVTGMPTGTGTRDYVLTARMLVGAYRSSIKNASNPSADYATVDNETSNLPTLWQQFDTTRPKRQLIAFPNGTSGQASNVSAVVARYTGVDYWEGQNEPGGNPGASFAATQQEFYNAVKAARSSAQVLGPCPVAIGGSAQSNLAAFFNAGGGNYIDRVSFHTYNSHLGDLTLGRKSWDNFVAMLTTYGQQAKPRVITEAGGFLAAEYGAGAYVRQAVQGMLDLLLCEQYGVQKEDWFYYYPQSMGYDAFPSWMSADGGAAYPLVGTLLTHSQELLGTTWEARHDFGSIDNNSIIGSSYRRGDGTGVVSVMSSGRTAAPVVYQVTGGSPASLTLIDCWGNQSTVAVTSGLATVTASTLPQYVRLPAGVSATPVSTNSRYGINRTSGATAAASAGSLGITTPASTLSGPFLNALYNDTSNGAGSATEPWQGNTPLSTTSPQTFDITLSGSVPVDTVIIHCPPPWQAALTVLKDFDVQTWNGTAWVTQNTVTRTPTVVLVTSTKQDGASSWYDSFWNDEHIYEVKFPALVTTSKIRLNVREVTYGAIPTAAARDASGSSDLAGMGTTTPRMAIQRITVLDSTSSAAADAGTGTSTGKYVVKSTAFS